MCDLNQIESLKKELRSLCSSLSSDHYGDMPRVVQGTNDLANALYMKLELLKEYIQNPETFETGPAKNNEGMGDKFRLLAEMADTGLLGEALNPQNLSSLNEIAKGVGGTGMTYAALHKKDMANYLSASADTDILEARHKEVDELVRKKDK